MDPQLGYDNLNMHQNGYPWYRRNLWPISNDSWAAKGLSKIVVTPKTNVRGL